MGNHLESQVVCPSIFQTSSLRMSSANETQRSGMARRMVEIVVVFLVRAEFGK